MSNEISKEDLKKEVDKEILISIIIPSWFVPNQDGKYGENETFWFAQECLKRLLKATKLPADEDYEIIIIDNGSTLHLKKEDVKDGELTTNEYWKKADVLIRNQTNLGFGPACNQGFNIARGEYICCLNNDILVWEGWEEAMMEVFSMELEPKPGIVMPALMKETGDAKEALKLKEIDTHTNRGKFGAGAEFGSLWFTHRDILNKVKELNKKDADGQVFDQRFKLGMGEDRWLWQQIRLLGYETYRTHNTRVFHQGNMTIGKIKNRKEFTTENREKLADLKKEHGIKDEKKPVSLT